MSEGGRERQREREEGGEENCSLAFPHRRFASVGYKIDCSPKILVFSQENPNQHISNKI